MTGLLERARYPLAPLIAGALVGWFTARGKSQPIRLLDVVGVGPLMIYAGTVDALPATVRQALVFTGAATITFNGRNYLRRRVNT